MKRRPGADIKGGCGGAQPPHVNGRAWGGAGAPPQNTVCVYFLGSYTRPWQMMYGYVSYLPKRTRHSPVATHPIVTASPQLRSTPLGQDLHLGTTCLALLL